MKEVKDMLEKLYKKREKLEALIIDIEQLILKAEGQTKLITQGDSSTSIKNKEKR